MVLWSVRNILAMDADCSVAMHAANVLGTNIQLRHRNFLPAPLVVAIDELFTALLAAQHQVMWHKGTPLCFA